MTPWQYVKALGLPVFNVIFCAAWLVWTLVTDTGWERVVFPLIFTALLALAIWQLPRSLGSYRRMVDSGRRLGESRAKLITTMARKGYPFAVILRVDELLMSDRPQEGLALLQEHRPARRFPRPS